MNKDVKIGLAVGLLLLVALFVWLAMVSSKDPASREAGKKDADKAAALDTAPGTEREADARSARDWSATDIPGADNTAKLVMGGAPAPDNLAAGPSTDLTKKYLDLLAEGPGPKPATKPGGVTPPVVTPVVRRETPSSYVVKEGDTLSSISKSVYGTTRQWERIARANGIDDPSRLRLRMKLTIPPLTEEKAVVAVTDASVTEDRIHKVEEGETLSSISQKFYGSTRHVQFLMDANKTYDEGLLRAGSMILIPKLGTGSADAGERLPAAGAQQEYVVQDGDTFGSIAQQFYGSSRSFETIMRANNYEDPLRLRVGQKIVIPPKPGATVVSSPGRESGGSRLEPGEKTYVVREGDTLGEIASRELGSTRYVNLIKERNRITDENMLRTDDVIVIPSKTSLHLLSSETAER
jgi:nucleoid-associated protein YgaU